MSGYIWRFGGWQTTFRISTTQIIAGGAGCKIPLTYPPLRVEAEDPAHHRRFTFEHRGIILRTTITDCDTNIALSSLYRRREDMAADLLALFQDELPAFMPWSETRRRESDARHDPPLAQTFKETSEVRQKASKRNPEKGAQNHEDQIISQRPVGNYLA